MIRKCITCLAVWLLLAIPHARAQDGTGDSASYSRRGLEFSVGSRIHYSSPASYRSGGFVVFFAAGYCISPQLSCALKIYSGGEDVPQDRFKPTWGYLDVAGGGIEAKFFLVKESGVRPFVAAGYNLITLLSGPSGYNGSGPQIAGGVQLNLSRHFALSASTEYVHIRMYNLVGQDDPGGIFTPFLDTMLGINVSASFFPDVLP